MNKYTTDKPIFQKPQSLSNSASLQTTLAKIYLNLSSAYLQFITRDYDTCKDVRNVYKMKSMKCVLPSCSISLRKLIF